MKKINLSIFVIVLFLLSSCDGKKEQIPAYIHVKPFDLGSTQATADSKITDVWFFPKEEGYLGTYELPSTFPVLMEGSKKLFLDAGVKLNGIDATPDIYPPYKRFEIDVDLAPNQVDTIQPFTQYDSRVKFDYLEDFNSGNTLTVRFDTSSSVNVTTTDMGAYEGKSATFTIDENNPLFEVASLELMELPKSNSNRTFIEMHYKNESILQVGVVGYSGSAPNTLYVVALTPQAEWNKIYIELTPELVPIEPQITNFQLLIGATLQEGETSSTFYLDNLKVLHME